MTKNQWKLVVIAAFILFLYSFFTQQLWGTISALLLGILASRQNLFKEYDEKQAEKRRYYSDIMKKYREEKMKEKQTKDRR